MLQKIAAGLTGKPPRYGLASPLFEEFEKLESSNEMMLAALKTKAYRQHLLAQAGGDVSEAPDQNSGGAQR